MDTPEAASADHLGELPITWFRRRHRGKVRRALVALTGGALIYGIVAILLLPPLFFLAAGLWSVVTYTRAIVSLWDLFTSGQPQAFLDGLSTIDLPMHLALASGAYFALLFALIVINSGLLARGWRLLLLLPGLLLAVPAALVFLIDASAATETLTSTLGISQPIPLLATTYALVDLAVLAGILTDLRPRARRRRSRAVAAEPQLVSLPLLRFGPIANPAPFVVRPLDADAIEIIDGPPSDPLMTASVAKALADSLPLAILPVTPGQRDEALTRDNAEVGEP